jgi:branched-chain amino acid transport system ATP-binding protein
LKKKASYLSGGERHQLALAMVLLRSPKLLILDEPSSGLSPILMNDLFKILQNLKENEELTIILIEQNTLKAIEFFERLILIENGKIEKDANSFDLISNNKINDLIYR